MRHVLVTTSHRGVFFGEVANNADLSERTMTLKQCRNVIYWSGKRGFLGIAAHGPEAASKVGSTAPAVLLHDITSVSLCTDAAIKVFESWED